MGNVSQQTTSHTPGPWNLCSGDAGNHFNIESREYVNDGFEIAKLRGPDRKANARLIAAAPELLEALQRILAIHCPLTGDPSHETLVAFWEREQSEGRGEAGDQLFALSAIAKAVTNA